MFLKNCVPIFWYTLSTGTCLTAATLAAGVHRGAMSAARVSFQVEVAEIKPPASAHSPDSGSAPKAKLSVVNTAATPRPAETVLSIPTVAPAKDHRVPDEYQIGSGDILQISVWKEPDASVPSAVVRPDGKIGLPLIKEANVAGLTPTEAEQLITEGLEKFIPGADVTVVVTSINSKKVYVLGAVKKEGPISYTYRMTIMQALSEAGGLTDYAKQKKIYVLRSQSGKTVKLPFDYNAVLKGEHMEMNIPLLPSDTLVVPH